MTTHLETLAAKGVAHVPYEPELRQAVADTLQLWQDFVELPLEDKQHYLATKASDWLGYEIKDGSGPHGDRKQNFDISASYPQPGLDQDPFIKNSYELSVVMAQKAQQVAQEIGAQYDIDQLKTTKLEDIEAFVRFLYYPGHRQVGDLFGEPHTDQSGMTFHLAETSDGCERLDPKTREWLPMPVDETEGLLFGAMQLQLLSNGEIPALCHRIRTNQETASVGRYAVVCFVRFLGDVPLYDKDKHGRLQERTPGFNYDLSTEEFAKLFTK